MSLNLSLITEEGGLVEEIEDNDDRIFHLIPPGQERAFPFLARILEGDVALISGDDVDYLIEEIQRLEPRASANPERKLLVGVAHLAERCRRKASLSLEFTVYNQRGAL